MIATYPQTISTSPDLAEVFPRKREAIPYAKGEVIQKHLDSVFHVNSGIVRTYRECRKRKMHVGFYLQDEFLGESCLIGCGGDETAVAFSDCVVTRWERGEFEDQLGKGQLLSILRMIGERAENRKNTLLNYMLTPRMLDRLCQALASLRFGQVLPNGDTTLPAITHDELSQIIGTSREVVTHHMVALRREGIEYSHKAIILPAEFVAKWRQVVGRS